MFLNSNSFMLFYPENLTESNGTNTINKYYNDIIPGKGWLENTGRSSAV